MKHKTRVVTETGKTENVPSIGKHTPLKNSSSPLVSQIVGNRKPFIRQAGLTLIELMVTLAIAVILLSLAVPNFSNLVNNSRVVTAANNLTADINLARSEAIKRARSVVMCRSGNPEATAPVCCETNGTGCSNESWTSGWLIYAYGTSETTQRSFSSVLGDALIKRRGPAPEGVQIKTNSTANNWLIYGSNGTILEAGTGIFGVCNQAGSDYDRRLVSVSLTGRAHIDDGDTIPCDPT